MNNIQTIICIAICLFIFNQNIMGMKRIKESSFQKFSSLSPEMQLKIFTFTDSKANLQLLNKNWSEDASIRSPRVFDNDLAGLSKERMTRILIHAAYVGNYEGVENILKNSSLLGCPQKDKKKCTKNHMLYYYMDTTRGTKIIDFYDVVSHQQETKWLGLLKKYRIMQSSAFLDRMVPYPLIMSCLTGNSYLINTIADDTGGNLKNALYIAIDCGYYSCVKELIDSLYRVSSFGEWSFHVKNIKLLLTLKTLQFACLKRNMQIIEEILKTKEFDVNEIQATIVPTTFLDQVMENAQHNSEYNDIVLLLQKYGAKTIQEVREIAEEEKDIILKVSSCVIS